jgi:hypothetical protein
MNLGEIIQYVATGSAVILGLTYIVGGLIVNLNLARRGLVEFEILKTKYLVVGIVFLLHVIGVFTFAALPAFALLLPAWENEFLNQAINLVSMLASGSLLVIWARYPPNTKSILGTWWYWFAASAVGAIFPMLIILRQILAPRLDLIWVIVLIQAILTAALTFLAQAYHYSAFYYGRNSGFGGLDPVGVGMPSRVLLACDEKSMGSLKGLGISIDENGITGPLYLIDETDRHYIIGFHREAESGAETLKIEKSLIKAILFKPDRLQPARKKSPEKH